MSTVNILLSPAKATDFDFYYTLKCEPDSIYWSGYTNAPDKDKLQNWFTQSIYSRDKANWYRLYIISTMVNGFWERAGYLSLYPTKEHEKCCEIGIGILSTKRGRGIAVTAIKEAAILCKSLRFNKIYAYIRHDNIASQTAFSRAGFEMTDKVKEVWIANLQQMVEMREYIYPLKAME